MSNMSVYSGVAEAAVVQLDDGRFFACVRAYVQKPGYDIPPVEDMFRTFSTRPRAQAWVDDKVAEIEKACALAEQG